MGRKAQYEACLPSGEHIGFSLKPRQGDPFLNVFFKGKCGRRLERSTGSHRVEMAKTRALKIIQDEYETPQGYEQDNPTWETALEGLRRLLTEENRKEETSTLYFNELSRLRRAYPDTLGPRDITPKLAAEYRSSWRISASSANSYLNRLSAIFGKYFVQLKLVPSDPFEDIRRPTVPKNEQIRVLSPEEISLFKTWLLEYFDGWELPCLWFRTKLLTGCRTSDLSSLLSTALHDGKLWFPATVRKKWDNPAFPLPSELYAKLDAIKGQTYLWESYTEGKREIFNSRGHKVYARQLAAFAPCRLGKRMRDVIQAFRLAHPEIPHFRMHNTRSTAISLLWAEGYSAEQVGMIVGCSGNVVKQYYLSLDKVQLRDNALAKLMAKLDG